jgi:hypothetical protein
LAHEIDSHERKLGTGSIDDEGQLTEEEIEELERDLDAALAEDTPEKWREDQATIENYHLERYGHLNFAERLEAFGADKKAMWKHSLALLREGVREAEEQLTESAVGDTPPTKLCEKPVRLHPDPSHHGKEFAILLGITEFYYTPEFADGRKDRNFARFFPYRKYPDFDGDTVIEFCD